MRLISEAEEQSNLMDWAQWMEGSHPELRLLFHIPNGGSRHPGEAKHLKRQGVRSGVPDLFLPSAHGIYHGLFIEMKAQGGRVSDHQREWIKDLNAQGYRAVVCYGFDEARKAIEEYLDE